MAEKRRSGKGQNLEKKFNERYQFYIPSHLHDFLSDVDMRRFLSERFHFFKTRKSPISLEIKNHTTEGTWPYHSAVIEVVMIDAPFIVDTILDYLNALDISINSTIQPVLSVKRDDQGELTDIRFTDETIPAEYRLESFVYIEIPEQSEARLQKMKKEISSNLHDLQVVVQDFPIMLEHLYSLDFHDENLTHDAAWLKRNFVFLGMITANRDHNSHFGFFRNANRKKEGESFLELSNFENIEQITFIETDLISKVDRKREIYFIYFYSRGRSLLLAGHFTRRANLTPRSDIPFIRRKLDRVAEKMKIHSTSHMYKELLNASIIFPVGTLATRNDELTFGWVRKIFHSFYTEEPTTEVFLDSDHSRLWILAIVPLQDSEQVDTSELRRLESEGKFIIRKDVRHRYEANEIYFLGLEPKESNLEALRKSISNTVEKMFSSWRTRFRHVAENRLSGGRSVDNHIHIYLSGMSPDNEIHQTPEEAFDDVFTLDNMDEGDPVIVRIYKRNEEEDFIKVYSTRRHYLSDLIPTLNQFSYRVQSEYTFPFETTQSRRYTYAFSVPTMDLNQADRNRIALVIAEAINGSTTREPMNALAVSAGLTGAELNIIKALTGYYFQVDKSHSRFFLGDVLQKYPPFVRALVDFFHSRLSMEDTADPSGKARENLDDSFGILQSALEESICRKYTEITSAIVRTGAYLHPNEVSFKIHSKDISGIPWPVPLFEIYVYSTIYEGIHLRSGYVARGGIRWSDRPDDFRTEVHGLMKAQMVKNTIIVPAGSKGGFAIKTRNLLDNQNPRSLGKPVYRRFIRCLLELTDNLDKNDRVIPLENIKRLDKNDAYLVVAADKGTASFSDTANEISDSMDYWLSDAFASGGQYGYDHKEQGITARGAWESVRHHFLEMGRNPEKDPITVTGVGDMSGDVFGNGLLLSRSIRLIAAFNHLYIFLDPNPDEAISYKERKRLFDRGLNWDSYNTEKISSGGGIFERSARNIKLSTAVQDSLGISRNEMSGEELIRAILEAPVDMFWNGGIGTYIKSSHENHFEAGDPSNDRVRVDANRIRCRVIGEGGNLGLTQAGRIEAASSGVRLNTDAIDNSGGVDMSDHEVNLKILLDKLVRTKKLRNREERNQLIRKYEKEMIHKVLWHNQFNNLGLSLDEKRSRNQLSYYRSLIRRLVREKIVNRSLDHLPLESELDTMEEERAGIPRPSLASLMGFVKMYIKNTVLESEYFSDPWYDRFVLDYFPEELGITHKKETAAHPLKKEIVVTEIVSRTINYSGIDFFERMTLRTQRKSAEILDAFIRLEEFINPDRLRSAVQPGTGENPDVYYNFLIFLQDKMRRILETLLESEEGVTVIFDANREEFQEILDQASSFSHENRQSPISSTVVSTGVANAQSSSSSASAGGGLSAKKRKSLENAYRSVDVLEDAFDIFAARKRDGHHWKVEDYFQALDDFRIREIRPLAEGITPTSTWEEPFLIRIEHSLKELTSLLMEVRAGSEKAYEKAFRQNIERIEELFRLRDSQKLGPAAFYEILGRIKEDIDLHRQ